MRGAELRDVTCFAWLHWKLACLWQFDSCFRQFWKKRWRHDSIVLLKIRKNRKKIIAKNKGAFFKACSRSTCSISGTSELAVLMKKPFPSLAIFFPRQRACSQATFSLLFECQEQFRATLRYLKSTVIKQRSTTSPPYWRASNVSTCLYV